METNNYGCGLDRIRLQESIPWNPKMLERGGGLRILFCKNHTKPEEEVKRLTAYRCHFGELEGTVATEDLWFLVMMRFVNPSTGVEKKTAFPNQFRKL